MAGTNQGLNVQLSADVTQFVASLQAAIQMAESVQSNFSATAATTNTLTSAATAATTAANALAGALNNTQSASNSATTSANNLATTFARTNGGWSSIRVNVADYNRQLTGLTPVTRALINDARNGQVAYVGLGGAITMAGRATVPLNSALNNLNRTSRNTGYIFTNIGRIVSDMPFGFIAIQNNIDPLIASLGGPAGLAVAFSIVGAALTTLSMKYGGLSKAFETIFGTVSDATKSTRAYAESLNGASDSFVRAYEEVNTLKNNIDLAKNGIIDKNKVVKQYNETIGKTTGAVRTLEQAEKALAENADAYIKFTLLKAAAQIALQKAAEQAFKAQEARNKSDEESVPYIMSGLKGKGKDSETLYKKAAKREREIVAQENDKTQALFEKIAKDFQDQAAEISKKNKFNFFAGDITEKKVKTVEEILKALSYELKDIDNNAKLVGASFDSISGDKLNAYQKALKELTKIGLNEASVAFKDVSNNIELFNAKIIGSTPLIGKRLQEIGKAFKFIKIDPGALQNVDKFQSEFLNKVDVFQKAIQQKIDKTTIQWANISSGLGPAMVNIGSQLRALAVNSAVALGEVIGAIASGGESLSQSLGKLVGVMGQFIVDFGKSLIEAATLRIIADKTLLTNPYVALAAGIAAIAIGSVLKNKTPSFAEGGGFVGSPGLAMIGDNPGRAEYVIPSEVLDKLGGNQRSVRVIGVLRGQDLLLQNERAKRVKARV